MSHKHRIVVLCGPELHHLHTCATLVRAGLNVGGICLADQRTARVPLKYLWKSAKRKGIWPTISRSLARVAYLALNSRLDRAAYNRLFDPRAVERTLRPFAHRVYRTNDYSSARTMAWLKQQQPDVLVVHSPYWIGKNVRNLPRTGIVLGGHPGLTPDYRGSHSPFWAIYSQKPHRSEEH